MGVTIYPEKWEAASGEPKFTANIILGSRSVTAGGVEDVVTVSFSGNIFDIAEGFVG